jgi:hypothetical protein
MSATASFFHLVACMDPDIGQSLMSNLNMVDRLALTRTLSGLYHNRGRLLPVWSFLRQYFPDPLKILKLCDGNSALLSGPAVAAFISGDSYTDHNHEDSPALNFVVSVQTLAPILSYLRENGYRLLDVVDWEEGVGVRPPDLWTPTTTHELFCCMEAELEACQHSRLPFRAKYSEHNIPLIFTVSIAACTYSS